VCECPFTRTIGAGLADHHTMALFNALSRAVRVGDLHHSRGRHPTGQYWTVADSRGTALGNWWSVPSGRVIFMPFLTCRRGQCSAAYPAAAFMLVPLAGPGGGNDYMKDCPHCYGTGIEDHSMPRVRLGWGSCSACGGYGIVPDSYKGHPLYFLLRQPGSVECRECGNRRTFLAGHTRCCRSCGNRAQ
jgi:hypothetical protein